MSIPEANPLRHRINQKLIRFENHVVFDRVECRDPAYHSIGMLYSEGTKGTGRKYLERLSMKQHTARIVRLFVEIISETFKTAFKVLLGIDRPYLQVDGETRQLRRRWQALHHGLCR